MQRHPTGVVSIVPNTECKGLTHFDLNDLTDESQRFKGDIEVTHVVFQAGQSGRKVIDLALLGEPDGDIRLDEMVRRPWPLGRDRRPWLRWLDIVRGVVWVAPMIARSL